MKRARFEEWLGNAQFPTIAPQRGGVKQKRDKIQFIRGGIPCQIRAGLTLAVIPKSVIQTSPGLTAGIFVLHAVQHHRAFQGRLIAGRDIQVLVGDFEKRFANRPPFPFAQPGEFIDDFGGTHGRKLTDRARIVRKDFTYSLY